MKASALLRHLDQLGVHLSADMGTLRYRAPKGVMTDWLKEQLSLLKRDIIILLLFRDPGVRVRFHLMGRQLKSPFLEIPRIRPTAVDQARCLSCGAKLADFSSRHCWPCRAAYWILSGFADSLGPDEDEST